MPDHTMDVLMRSEKLHISPCARGSIIVHCIQIHPAMNKIYPYCNFILAMTIFWINTLHTAYMYIN